MAKDYSVLNLDLKPLDPRGANTLMEGPLWNEVEEGELLTYVARSAANNVLRDGDTFTTGYLGTFTFKNETIVFNEPLVFTKDNIDRRQF